MSVNFELEAQPRQQTGTSASRRFRREGKVPVNIYGAGKENQNLIMDHDELLHHLEVEAFHSSIITIKTDTEQESTILRDVDMHPYLRQVLHIDFQRILATEEITIDIPIHFLGDEDAPGVKLQGGIFSRRITEVEVSCLPADLPEYLEVDVSHLDINDSVNLTDIELPEGVTLKSLEHDEEDVAIASVLPPVVEVEEVPAEEELEAAELAEGEEPKAEEAGEAEDTE